MIRFHHARICTMEHPLTIMEGELWTDGESISFVGDSCSAKETIEHQRPIFTREVDCQNNLLMPGFKNAHTHSAMTFLRSRADDLPLEEWLTKQVFPYEARLTPEDVYTLNKLAILEYLTSGITANFDMYFYMAACAKSSAEMGFRTVYCGSVNDYSGTCEQILARTEEEYLTLNRFHPLISYQMGFHAEYTTSYDKLERLSALCRKYRAPMYTHIAETSAEVEGCKSRYGKTPFQLMDDLGLFDYGGGGFHGIWLEDGDFSICKKRGLYIVTNPSSNVKLASGIAPLTRFLEEDIPLAIGTDGPASNNCLDMFREMFLTAGLQKLRTMDAAAMPAEEVLYMATAGGAHAMGLKDCDILAPGKQADLILVNLKRPNMQPEHKILANLVYSGSKENIAMTMVAGKVLYENGQFYTAQSPEEIYSEVTAVTRRIFERT